MKHVFFLLLLFTYLLPSFAQRNNPKREFRGAWITSVENLDWPSSINLSVSQQKQELIKLLDALNEAGINAVLLQIRPACDALYKSDIEPWSYWLTGQQGKSPGGYDPLEFAIEETHARGMELHAWFNPYRAEVRIGAFTLADNHVVKANPDWILTFDKVNLKLLNPGLPQVRNYVTEVVLDVVNRYDVDGVHFDDYFYPYPDGNKNFSGITTEDNSTFENYSRGILNKNNWRCDNVNLLVEQIFDSIQVVKPWVKFGISPFGIWQSGVPSGIWGLSAYHEIYCDARAWLDNHTVDYITPQCYWPIGGGQDYSKLVPWWASVTNGRHLYPGQIFRSSYSSNELPNQVAINRATEGVYGNVLFRASNVASNSLGFAEYLANDFHQYPSLLPQMTWKDPVPPNSIQNLRYENLLSKNMAGLNWDLPAIAIDGDSMSRSVIYRFNTDQFSDDDLLDPANILSIGGYDYHVPEDPETNGPYYYVVTALDRNWNESRMSNIVMVPVPDAPTLVSPVNIAAFQRDTTLLIWNTEAGYSSFKLQVSVDSLFTEPIFFEQDRIQNMFFPISNLTSMSKYFWRLKMANAGGISTFSDIFSFSTGPFPEAPLLAAPQHRSRNTALELSLIWHPDSLANLYRIQISKATSFDTESIVFDTSNVTDTLVNVGPLDQFRTYYWHVQSYNDYGYSSWSNYFRFRTGGATDIEPFAIVLNTYELKQNYPNPFNPVTQIEFSLANPELVEIDIYDIQGKLVETLVDHYFYAGSHQIQYNGFHLSSGVYIYTISAGTFRKSKKMILVR